MTNFKKGSLRKTLKKRIFSLFLAVVLVVMSVPTSFATNTGADTSVVGKVVQLSATGLIYAYPDPAKPSQYSLTGSYAFPAYMVVEDVYASGNKTYYQLYAAEGYTWPDASNITEGYWLESTQVAFVETCDKCGEVNCTKNHTFCPYCDAYDCELVHDSYQPYVAPVIPEDPTLTPNADVSLVDEHGDPVTSDLVLEPGKKYSLSAWPNLTGEVTYQWQACYNNTKMLWIDVYGQTGKGILASATMFSSLVDAQGMTYLRCVTTNGTQTMYSDPIAVHVTETATKATRFPANKLRNARSATGGEDNGVQPVDDSVKYTITVKYEIKNVVGVEAPEPYVVHLAAGSNYVLENFEPPEMMGFYAGYADESRIDKLNETFIDIQADQTIVVYYWPDFVDFEVHHYKQRVAEDKYDLVATDIVENLKTGEVVGNALAKTYEGFNALPYDNSITVAADGSTVINIYYDRQYFMIAIDLNGGYGAEPIYARYETPISIPNPKRAGYTFKGWKNLNNGKLEAIVPTMPVISQDENFRITYQAQWDKANTSFTVAVWYENADPEADGTYLYTFMGSVQMEGKTEDQVYGPNYAYLNSASSADHYEGYDAEYAKHFSALNTEKTDKYVTIKSDGTTVVNLYFYRNSYELSYYKWKCNHTHTNECCTLQHTSHSDSCCSIPEHTNHTTGCVTNELTTIGFMPSDKTLNNQVSSLYNGVWVKYRYILADRYYIYFDGVWYRTANGNSGTDSFNWDCCRAGRGQYTHVHNTSSCDCSKAHDHSAGRLASCNTSSCKHLNPASCYKCGGEVSDMNNWTPVHKENHKFESTVGHIHQQMSGSEGIRWTDMYFGGVYHSDEQYGAGGAMSTFYSMPGGRTTFFQGNKMTNPFRITYWLETTDGSGTRTFQGRNFAKGTTFFTKMGHVAWSGDYLPGIPAGFEALDGTYGTTDNTASATDNFETSLKKTGSGSVEYHNFYFVRKTHDIIYFNGKDVTTRKLMFDQLVTDAYDLGLEDMTAAEQALMVSPNGPGYDFDGWFLDPECTVEVDWNNIKMPDGDMALHAKWKPITHEVKLYLTKEKMLAGEPLENFGPYEILHGEAYDGTVGVPDNGMLSFIGWFYEEDGKEVAYDFSMPVYRNMNLYGKWSSSVSTWGTIYYEDVNGNKLAEPTRVTGMVDDTKTFSAKFGAEIGDGTTLYFPNVTSHSIKFASNPDQNTFTFVYTILPEVEYTIRFVDKNNFDKDDPSKDLLPSVSGTAKTATISYDVRENGKLKDKYYVDKNSKEFALSSDPEHNVFFFYYTYDPGKATVQVEHYIERLDGSGYDFHSETPATTEVLEALIVAEDRKVTINGFYYDHATFNGVEKLEETLSGGLVLKLYYKRHSYSYTFRFVYQADGVNWVEFPNSAVTSTAKYRTQITQNAKTFAGYTPDAGAKSIIVDYDERNNVYTFYYTEEDVEIRYGVGAVKGGAITSTKETVSAITGTPVGSTATTTGIYYTFTGWYTDYQCTAANRVSTAATFRPEKTDGIFVSRTYYAGFMEAKADIKYEVVMPDGAPNATLEKTSEKVDIVTGIATGNTVATIPTGYEFAGWYDASNNLVSGNLSFVPVRPGQWQLEQTYYARFEKGKFSITWKDGFGNTIDTKAFEFGAAVSGIADPTMEGHTFIGWDTELPATMPAENLVITAQWQVNSYTVTWIVDGVETVVTYNYGEPIAELEKPEKGGYTFGGWDPVVPETMPAEDLTFTAQWYTKVSATINNGGTIQIDLEGQSGTLPMLPEVEVPVGSAPGAEFTFKPAEGYRIVSVTINDEAVDAGKFTEEVYKYTVSEAGITGPLKIEVVTALKTTALTIRVTGCDVEPDPDQSYLFTVTDSHGNALKVTVLENGFVTIEGVTIGETYTVTMEKAWSYRYKTEAEQIQLTIQQVQEGTENPNVALFTVERNFLWWLDGNAYRKK